MAETKGSGDRIAEARKRLGLTQTQLAELLGAHLTTVNRWEKGHQVPEGETLGRLAQALKVEEGWILRGGAFDSMGGAGELLGTPVNDPAYRLGHRDAIDAMRRALDDLAVLPPPVPAAKGGLGDALFPSGVPDVPAARPGKKRRRKAG